MKRYLAEFIGSFALVFFGTGAIIVNDISGGALGHAGISASFGLIVTAMIYSFGAVSGAHFNPAVSFAFSLAGLFRWKELPRYAAAQIGGAILASACLKLLFPANASLGSTIPSGSLLQSFVLEIILTFFLMLVILHTSQGSKELGLMAGIAIGSTVLLEAMVGGPISGASMNPARSIGPALVSGQLNPLWLYIAAPIAGAALATPVWRLMR